MARLAKAVAIGLFAASVAGTTASGEEAGDRAPSSCPDDAVCVWSKTDFRGDREVIKQKGKTKLSDKLDNKVTSVKNNRDEVIYLLDKRGGVPGSDDYQCVGGNSVFFDLEKNADWDNRTSAVYVRKPGKPELPC